MEDGGRSRFTIVNSTIDVQAAQASKAYKTHDEGIQLGRHIASKAYRMYKTRTKLEMPKYQNVVGKVKVCHWSNEKFFNEIFFMSILHLWTRRMTILNHQRMELQQAI